MIVFFGHEQRNGTSHLNRLSVTRLRWPIVKPPEDVLNSRDPEHGLNKGMAEATDTSGVADPPDLGPGYRLAARGRQEAEDDRLSLLERILDPLSCRRRELVRPG